MLKNSTPDPIWLQLDEANRRAGCRLVPPQAVIPFHQAVRSTDTKLLWYQGDTGVSNQHVGMLVGRQAHRQLWPDVIRWVHAH